MLSNLFGVPLHVYDANVPSKEKFTQNENLVINYSPPC